MTLAMSETDRDRISAAVTAAESATAGEIVTILTPQSDDYHDIALIWSALIALLALVIVATFSDYYLALWARIMGTWVEQWHPGEVLAVAALIASLKFLGTYLILLWRPFRVWLTPAAIRHQRVRARAITCFKVGAERRTQGRTGVLIYVSMAEHRAEIVADEAIASKVPAETWGAALAAMLAEIRAGRMADGMIAALGQVGAVLAEHFPRAEDDVNELPDRLIEV